MLKQGTAPEAIGEVLLPGQLPPLNNLPQWSRLSTLDKARYPKPFRKDTLGPLVTAGLDGVMDFGLEGVESGERSEDEGMDGAMRMLHLERSLHFLQQQHQDVLHELHTEIDNLKRQNQDLQFRIIMVQQGSPGPTPPKTASPGNGHSADKVSRRASGLTRTATTAELAQETDTAEPPPPRTEPDEKIDAFKSIFLEEEIKDLKKVLKEERHKNDYLTQLIEQAQTRFLDERLKEENPSVSEAMSAPPHTKAETVRREESFQAAANALPYNAQLDPLQVQDHSGANRNPSTQECEVIIKHLLRLNDRQAHELTQLKSDLRDVLYSHKWTPDAYLLAKAYVVEEEDSRDAAHRQRLPRLQLKQNTRKLPELAYIQRDQVMLPALKQTMGNKAIERRKRTQMMQKSRQRREVLH